MGAGRFIASRLAAAKGENDSHSRISNRIAWISVCLSIAIMIVAVAVLGGFKSHIRQKATGFMGSAMLVMPGQDPLNERFPFPDTLSYAERILSLKGVKSVSGVAYCSGLLKTPDQIEGLYFKGVDSLYDFSFFKECLQEGSLPDYGGRVSNDVLISRHTASKMGYKVGDALTVYFIGEDVKARKFTVCGIFDAGLDEIDTRFAVADLRQVVRINGWNPHEVSSVEVRAEGALDPDRLARQVRDIEYAYSTDSDPSLFTTSVKKVYGALFDWLALLDLNVLMILVLMVIVAGFNMISAVLIILFEKISMIGLLKSLGMTTREVGKVFLLRSGAIVGKGMLWGNVIGISLCLIQKYAHVVKLDRANYFVDWVPIDLNIVSLLLLNVIAAVLIMLIISVSTIFISKVSPDRTMRME